MDFRDYPEEFYARYNVELIRAPEGFFYLRPRSTTLISRLGTVRAGYDGGQNSPLAISISARSAWRTKGIFTQQELYDELLTLADESRAAEAGEQPFHRFGSRPPEAAGKNAGLA